VTVNLSKIRGCVSYPSITHNLVKHQNEREGEKETHTPEKRQVRESGLMRPNAVTATAPRRERSARRPPATLTELPCKRIARGCRSTWLQACWGRCYGSPPLSPED
jgi:hypothetical protein